jgi:hypothetical protein
MTPEEHRLVLWVLVRQMQSDKILLEILKSRGVLERDDDPEAYASSVALDERSNHELLAEAKAEYLKIAKTLGVETGLEPKS